MALQCRLEPLVVSVTWSPPLVVSVTWSPLLSEALVVLELGQALVC